MLSLPYKQFGEHCGTVLTFPLEHECFVSSLFPAEILQANDNLSRALGQYRQVVVSQENGDGAGSAASSAHAPGEKHPQRPMAALPCMPGGSGV